MSENESVVVPISSKVSERVRIRRRCYRLAIEILDEVQGEVKIKQ